MSLPSPTQLTPKTLSKAELPPTDYCVVEGRAQTSSALLEVRSFDWSHRHEGSVIPPSSYLELTHIRAVGRYDNEQTNSWKSLGNIRYHPANNEFHCRWYEDRQVALLCAFNSADVLGYDADIDAEHLTKTHDLQNPYLLNLLVRSQQELENPGLVSEVILESLSDAIVGEWSKQFTGLFDEQKSRCRGDRLNQTDIRQMIAKIREQRCAPTVVELAQEQGLNPRYFSRLVKQATGQTIAETFKQERIKRAKDLLANRTLLIKEVAYQCGFENSASFCKSFRATTGISPNTYRQRDA